MKRNTKPVVAGIPASEKIWLIQKVESGNTYYVTAKESRDMYFIYKDEDGKAVKQGKGQDPADLVAKYAR